MQRLIFYAQILFMILIYFSSFKGFTQNNVRLSSKMLDKATYHDWDKVVKLLNKGAEINYQREAKNTVLHYIVTPVRYGSRSNMSNTEICKFLLSKGANPNLLNNQGLSPLMIAAKNNQFNFVKMLVENGADVNLTNNEGYNALYLVGIEKNKWDQSIIKYLKQAGSQGENWYQKILRFKESFCQNYWNKMELGQSREESTTILNKIEEVIGSHKKEYTQIKNTETITANGVQHTKLVNLLIQLNLDEEYKIELQFTNGYLSRKEMKRCGVEELRQ